MIERKLFVALLVAGVAVGCHHEKKVEPAPAPTAPAPKPEDKTVSFAKKSPAVGQKTEETDDMDMTLSMNVDAQGTGKPQKTDTSSDDSVKYTQEVLAASGDSIGKVRASFDKVDEKSKQNGKETKKASVIAGKTYVVEAKNGKIEVSDDKGKAAPAAEAKEVQKHFQSLGKPDPVLAGLPAMPLKPGDKVDSLAKAITDEMKEESDGMKVSDVAVIYKEKSGDDGLFDVTMKMAKEDGAMTMAMDLKGQLRVSTKTGLASQMDLKGPITVGTKVDPKSKAKYDGSGSVTMKLQQKAI